MNKQLTKKLIGIAASAALIGSMALSASAIAGFGGGKGNKGKGPQTSAAVSTWCEISDEAAGEMTVHVTVQDRSSGVAAGFAQIAAASVQGETKSGGRFWTDIAGALATPDLMVAPDQAVTLNICGSPLGKAINAETKIVLDETFFPSNKEEYRSKCGDNPYTLEVIEGGIKTAEYPDLCLAAP